MIDFLKNKKIAILGVGIEGISTLRFLYKNGLKADLLDENLLEDDLKDQDLKTARNYKFGKDAFSDLQDYDLIFRSPGIPFLREAIQDFIKKGGIVTSQMKLFFDLCPCSFIGVTGTKGKGTTASLIYEMLIESGLDAYLGGNIGTPPLDFLEKLNKDSIVVLELSSFQLQDLTKSPFIAVMLMITSEHLDHHKDVSEYIDAKRNILRRQDAEDFAVLNRDYIATNESDIFTEGKVFHVTREREYVTQGAFIKENAIWMRMQETEWKIIDTKDILLPGKHNWENAEAAVVAATLGGADKASIVNVLKTFRGLEHRLELVREINGVRYYDDSFSTTPETAIAAIQAFEAPDPSASSGQVILILGGSSKGSDFSELGRVISEAKNIKAIIGIGDEWRRIKSALRTKNHPFGKLRKSELRTLLVEDATDMRTIVLAASKIATPGDVVLLSPACASFGMFRNYKDRGEQFRKEVLALV